MKSLKKTFLALLFATIFSNPSTFAMEQDPYFCKPTPPTPIYNNEQLKTCIHNSIFQVLFQIPKFCAYLDTIQDTENILINYLKSIRENFKQFLLTHNKGETKQYLKNPQIVQNNSNMAKLREQIISCSKTISEKFDFTDSYVDFPEINYLTFYILKSIFNSTFINEETTNIHVPELNLIVVWYPNKLEDTYLNPAQASYLQDINKHFSLVGITFGIRANLAKDLNLKENNPECDYKHCMACLKHQRSWFLCDDFFREYFEIYKPLVMELENGLRETFDYLKTNQTEYLQFFYLKNNR